MISQDRHLAAILFTDIVGYTSMMQRDEANAVHIIKRYQQVLKSTVSKYHGLILNDYGDGSLCSFNSIYDACKSTLELQHELQQDPTVPLRAGLHIGEILFDNGKALGDGVNVASRIQSLGIANSILISSEVQHNIKNHLEFKTTSLGKFEFKNVQEPIEVFALINSGLNVPYHSEMNGKLKKNDIHSATGLTKMKLILFLVLNVVLATLLASLWFYYKPIALTAPADKSIAVLPFVNLSNDPEQVYFSNGITEDILNHLVKVKDLKVKSRTSTLPYKDTDKSITEIGKELGVNHILEGSVRKVNQHVRVVVQLIDARNDIQIWSETYDRKLEDILVIQSDIAMHTAKALELQFATQPGPNNKGTEHTIAYDYFLQSREAFNNSLAGENKLILARTLVNRAINLHPSFAEAYALKSRIYYLSRIFGVSEKEWRDSSLWFATKSIELDTTISDGYFARSQLYYYLGRISEYSADLQHAFSLSPNDPDVLERYGYQLLDEGVETGAEYVLRGIESKYGNNDPLYYIAWSDALNNMLEAGYPIREKILMLCKQRFPDFTNVYFELGYLYRQTGAYDKFLQQSQQAFAIAPKAHFADNLAWAYFILKDYDQAIKYWSFYSHYESQFSDSTQRIPFRHRLGMAYWAKGEKEKADLLFKEQLSIQKRMITSQQSRGVQNSSMAGVYYDLAVCEAYFDHYEEALDALQKCYFEYHFFWTWGLKREPLFQKYSLRPEFQELLQKVEEVEKFKKDAFQKGLKKVRLNTETEKLLKGI